jgi:hypothetical protein
MRQTHNITFYDESGNYFDQTRYEIMRNNKKIYIYGYDNISKSERHLDIEFSFDMNKSYKKILSYSEYNNMGNYTYHYDKKANKELYNLIIKTYHLKKDTNDNDENMACIVQ